MDKKHLTGKKHLLTNKHVIAIILCLLAVSFIVIAVSGGRYTYTYSMAQWGQYAALDGDEEWLVTTEDPGIVEISGVRVEEKQLKVDLKALKRGRTYLEIQRPSDGIHSYSKVYVHRFGIITISTYFGRCTGGVHDPVIHPDHRAAAVYRPHYPVPDGNAGAPLQLQEYHESRPDCFYVLFDP